VVDPESPRRVRASDLGKSGRRASDRVVRRSRRTSISVLLCVAGLLGASCGSSDPNVDSTTASSSGALSQALQDGETAASAIQVAGVGLVATVDGLRSDLGKFDVIGAGPHELGLEWSLNLGGLPCSGCGDPAEVIVETHVLVDEITRNASGSTRAAVELPEQTATNVDLVSAPLSLDLPGPEAHCILLMTSIQILDDGEPLATVYVDGLYQVGDTMPSETGCRLHVQADAGATWRTTTPDPAFECGFGRLLIEPGAAHAVAEVNACAQPQLLVAVPLDPRGTIVSCCFHHLGVPTGEPGSVLRRDVEDLEPGTWRSVLVSTLPSATGPYAGPFILVDWPPIRVPEA
jgi:hypothetical protein